MLIPKHIGKLALAGVLMAGVALAGCAAGNTGQAEDTDADTTVVDDDKATTDEDVEDVEDVEDADTTDEVEPTKWEAAETAEEAITKANLTGEFSVPEKLTAHGTEFSEPVFSYTDGIAQATYEQPASQVLVRKGIGPSGTVVADDDTGFAGANFAENWKISTDDGKDITCYGNEKDKVIFVEWYDKADPTADGEDDAYSIHAMGLGGEDIPMTEDEVKAIVAEVK